MTHFCSSSSTSGPDTETDLCEIGAIGFEKTSSPKKTICHGDIAYNIICWSSWSI